MFYINMLILLLSLTSAQCFSMQQSSLKDQTKDQEQLENQKRHPLFIARDGLAATQRMLHLGSDRFDTLSEAQKSIFYKKINKFIEDAEWHARKAKNDKDHIKLFGQFNSYKRAAERIKARHFATAQS